MQGYNRFYQSQNQQLHNFQVQKLTSENTWPWKAIINDWRKYEWNSGNQVYNKLYFL